MKKCVIGLTGGIASGKSEAARYLEKLGAYVIDADQIAREVAEDSSIKKELKKNWPLVYEGENLLRKELAKHIFSSKRDREKLNQILHPPIIKRILEEIQAFSKTVCVVVAPLLVETGLHKMVDKVWVIHAPLEVQVKRMMEREPLSHQEAMDRIKSQLSSDEKIAHADHVFENSGSLQALRDELKKEWEALNRTLS